MGVGEDQAVAADHEARALAAERLRAARLQAQAGNAAEEAEDVDAMEVEA